ncbi:hypothetical protein F5888DRAFT_1746657 [Russula emetica]|nr:hypothetical protein F5888DRAFT_1746657 [Russula emetica]
MTMTARMSKLRGSFLMTLRVLLLFHLYHIPIYLQLEFCDIFLPLERYLIRLTHRIPPFKVCSAVLYHLQLRPLLES